MAYPYDGMFYPTLPEDTQDFGQVLSGVGRSLRDISRGVSYYPYDLLGSGVDVANLALGAVGLGSERPVLGSDYLRNIARSLGMAQEPTGSATENITRLAAGLTNPMAGARAVGRVGDITTEQANRAADALVRQITGNPQATAPQVLQETSMPFMQAVAPRPSGLLETPVKSDLGFYSALEQATIPLQNKGTGSQFLAQIEKTAGVKPEEVKWTGLDDFLKSRQSVTKQEVQDYLAANRVDLQEVRLGEISPEQSATIAQAKNRYREITDAIANTRQQGEQGLISLQEARAILGPLYAERGRLDNQILSNTAPATKFSSYTLRGGENYREILLTLPQKQAPITMPDTSKWSVVRPKAQPEFSSADLDRLTELNRKISNDAAYGIQTPTETINEYKAISEMYDASRNPDRIKVFDEQGKLVGAMVNFDGTDEDIIQQTLRGFLQRQSQIANQQTNYRSSHFDQPNILAHMRVNDRVVDGKKTLFIEEVQSDWHQAGRKKGYAEPETKRLTGTVEAEPPSEFGFAPEFKVVWEDGTFSGGYGSREAAQARAAEGKSNAKAGVPDAPFKTTWHELSLKRAIQEASEKGYDQIAFTTGKTQAERYDLSKQVDMIMSKNMGNGVYNIEVVDKNKNVFFSKDVQESGLEEVVGKEMASKIVSDSAQKNRNVYRGLDLQMGGEGMKGFYDQILPKSLDKLGKKFDAKVGKTEMDGVEVWKMDITPKMRESVLTKGQPLFAATPALGLLGSEEE